MLILIWGFILLLAVAVVFLIWFQFKNQADKADPSVEQNQLQEKVHHLEENLKKMKEGVWVRLKGGKTIGRIDSIQNKKANVFFGSFKTIAELIHLVPVEDDDVPKKVKEEMKGF